MSNELTEIDEVVTSSQEEETTQRDPVLDWFLTHCHLHKYPAKSTLIHAGEDATTLYYVIKGSVMVSSKDDEGKEMILTYLGAGQFYKKYRQLIQANPEILMFLTAQLARRLQNTSRQVSNLAFLDVAGRIAQTLMNLAKQPDAMTHPDGMQIKITRQEIGQMVGCSRETVGRIIKMLEDQNLIHAHGKTIVVYGAR